jgi:hypothetical protein
LVVELPVNFPSCGTPNARIARFCGGYGTRLETTAAAAPETERRHICLLLSLAAAN